MYSAIYLLSVTKIIFAGWRIGTDAPPLLAGHAEVHWAEGKHEFCFFLHRSLRCCSLSIYLRADVVGLFFLFSLPSHTTACTDTRNDCTHREYGSWPMVTSSSTCFVSHATTDNNTMNKFTNRQHHHLYKH